LFAEFVENEVGVLTSAEAFLLINEIVPILINTENSNIRSELFELVIALARKSETTEIPSVLFEKWDHIRNMASNQGQYSRSRFNELSKYYRMNKCLT